MSKLTDIPHIFNYMALLACIVADKEITPFSALESFGIKSNDSVEDKRVNPKARAVIVTDLIENKEYPFNSYVEASDFLGSHKGTVGAYLAKNKIYRDRYKFTRKEDN